MARRRANGEGELCKRKFERPDGTTYTRYFARITTDHTCGQRHSGPLRHLLAEAKEDLKAIVELTDLGATKADLKLFNKKLKKGVTRPEVDTLKRKLKRSRGLAESDITLSAYLDQWLEGIKLHNKYGDFKTKRSSINRHIKPKLGQMKLSAIRRPHVQDFLDDIYREARASDRDGRATVRKCKATLHKAFEDAIGDYLGEYTANPVKKVKVPGEYSKPATLWSPEEASTFFELARRSPVWPAIYTALTSGLREGELCALRWQDLEEIALEVDGKLRTFLKINVRHTLVIVPRKDHEVAKLRNMKHILGSYFLDTPKTRKSAGHVLVAEDTLELLTKLRSEQLKASQGERYQDLGFVFASRYGAPRHPNKLYALFAELVKQAGVPRLTFHELRDSHLSRLQSLNVDLATTSGRARHSRVSTTADKYLHSLSANELNAVKTLDELFEFEKNAPEEG